MDKIALLTVLLLAGAWRAPASVVLRVKAAGFERADKAAEMALNFTTLLANAGRPGTLDENSLRVAELSADGTALDASVPFQFDKAPGYDAATNARGTLALLMKGVTPPGATRLYRVSFDRTGGSYAAPSFPALVGFTDNVTDEGQASYKLATASATWLYHKAGAGFSSLLDKEGKDWLNYHPTGGSAGNYRGIPNAVHPEGYFHPGNTGCSSSIAARGPLKVTIASQSNDGKWACRWEIYPGHARLTMLKHDHAYWFLYEGTPGGSLETATDYCVRSNGTRTTLATSWTADLPAPEWLYFGDAALGRVLYLVHHEDDTQTDSYWPMENNMTVFGFGRNGLTKYLASVPQTFTVGFAEATEHAAVTRAVNGAYRDLEIALDSDGDGATDDEELAAGSDPHDPGSSPGSAPAGGGSSSGGSCGATGLEALLLVVLGGLVSFKRA